MNLSGSKLKYDQTTRSQIPPFQELAHDIGVSGYTVDSNIGFRGLLRNRTATEYGNWPLKVWVACCAIDVVGSRSGTIILQGNSICADMRIEEFKGSRKSEKRRGGEEGRLRRGCEVAEAVG